MNKVIRANR